MSEYSTVSPSRFIALDIHKAYFVAAGVNAQRETVLGRSACLTASWSCGWPST